jgi:hypothetical protein
VNNLNELKNLLLVKCGTVETRTTLAQQLQEMKQGYRTVEKSIKIIFIMIEL